MSEPVPAVIVSLPARTVAEAREQTREAERAGADLVEVRVDRFSASERAGLSALFPAPAPLVATVRSRAEGGDGPDDPDERARLLVALARLPFRWLDAEASRDFPAAETLARPGVQDLIVSSHLPDGAEPRAWMRSLRDTGPPGSVRKVVGRSSVRELLSEILPILPPPGEHRLVVLTTGPSGPLLRVWSKRLRFPFVYASLPETDPPSDRPPVEPSQVPVDRLKGFLLAEGTPPLFAISGHPVAHSRSPTIHHHWMRQEGRIGLFVALDFADGHEFTESLRALGDGGFRGLSVTHPLKRAAFEAADETAPGAEACGVANTLTFGPNGVEAENTDLVAILRRLGELRDEGRWDGRSAGVVGAGGSARATLAALRTLGTEAFVWARRPAAAEALANEFGAHAAPDPRDSHPRLVVHATPVGRAEHGHSPPPDLAWVRPGVHVVDWVYLPEDPLVRVAAERAGASYEDGSRLLVYQAAASYGIWWGNEPSPDDVRSALARVR